MSLALYGEKDPCHIRDGELKVTALAKGSTWHVYQPGDGRKFPSQIPLTAMMAVLIEVKCKLLNISQVI